MATAATHFDNSLRYREGSDPEQTHLTPGYVLEPVRLDLGGSIGLDPCTTAENPTGALEFYTPELDGLNGMWRMWNWLPTVFVNPPYGKAREPWVDRCIEAAANSQRIVLLIPAATDTMIWQRAVSSAEAVVFVRGRLKFETLRPNRRRRAASHPSSLIGWNTDLAECSKIGVRWKNIR